MGAKITNAAAREEFSKSIGSIAVVALAANFKGGEMRSVGATGARIEETRRRLGRWDRSALFQATPQRHDNLPRTLLGSDVKEHHRGAEEHRGLSILDPKFFTYLYKKKR
jgi:hypothetical protein